MAISSVDLGLPAWEVVIILTCGLGLSSFALSGSNLDYSWNDARQGSPIYFICVVFTKSCFHEETIYVFYHQLYGVRLQVYVPVQPSA